MDMLSSWWQELQNDMEDVKYWAETNLGLLEDELVLNNTVSNESTLTREEALEVWESVDEIVGETGKIGQGRGLGVTNRQILRLKYENALDSLMSAVSMGKEAVLPSDNELKSLPSFTSDITISRESSKASLYDVEASFSSLEVAKSSSSSTPITSVSLIANSQVAPASSSASSSWRDQVKASSKRLLSIMDDTSSVSSSNNSTKNVSFNETVIVVHFEKADNEEIV
eukprot:CAMPEP_0184699638 /NCGR_PEP_ID=MMETSP0313-20130426/5840_1 /TAXON_ID=2792 /ORGANISM="Porphyridium aerugineum, Strain SAG 1380-2" /LENGTH=226 /DNA_ID=CAMNT_0027158757 /DNA_START=251 /DNA_END=931 /DNA_ORIENTATION=-